MIRYSSLFTSIFTAGLAGLLLGCATNRNCAAVSCPDARLTDEVQALFDAHAVLEPPNMLTVQTTNGVVYLNGLVATDLERQTAQMVALQAPGVSTVVNNIVAEK
jgi:osmotically-inducible protein OsmY